MLGTAFFYLLGFIAVLYSKLPLHFELSINVTDSIVYFMNLILAFDELIPVVLLLKFFMWVIGFEGVIMLGRLFLNRGKNSI